MAAHVSLGLIKRYSFYIWERTVLQSTKTLANGNIQLFKKGF